LLEVVVIRRKKLPGQVPTKCFPWVCPNLSSAPCIKKTSVGCIQFISTSIFDERVLGSGYGHM
jgi:hypothetical protein